MPDKDRVFPAPPSARRFGFLLVFGLCFFLGACATPPSDPTARAAFDKTNDPIEPTNRTIFAANDFLDKHTLKPVARAYRDHVPDLIQEGLHNVLANLQEPMIGLNDLLQGSPDRAWISFQRFMLNTLIGGLGLVDVASGSGIPFHDADFGETLGVWGIGEGPYVMLPVFGPSNIRDAVGIGAGFVLDPLGFVGGTNALYAGYARSGANAIDDRADQLDNLDELERDSVDFYAKLRSVYRQHRMFQIKDAKGESTATDIDSGSVDVGTPELSEP